MLAKWLLITYLLFSILSFFEDTKSFRNLKGEQFELYGWRNFGHFAACSGKLGTVHIEYGNKLNRTFGKVGILQQNSNRTLFHFFKNDYQNWWYEDSFIIPDTSYFSFDFEQTSHRTLLVHPTVFPFFKMNSIEGQCSTIKPITLDRLYPLVELISISFSWTQDSFPWRTLIFFYN